MDKFKMQILFMAVKKLIPYLLTAVGGFILATYPEVFQAICVQ